LYGHGGDDILAISEAGGILDGGSGNDTLKFNGFKILPDIGHPQQALIGIKVNLSTGIIGNDGFGGTGTVSNIENVIGTELSDIIIGDSSANTLTGLGGNDIFTGGLGDDTLDGGDGADIAVFSGYARITQSLQMQILR